MNINMAASVPASVAIYKPATAISDSAGLVAIWKNLATNLALTTTVIVTPDDMTEEGVNINLGVSDRENMNGGSVTPASISRTGTTASLEFSTSRDVPALETILFNPDTVAATASDPGYQSFSDKAGLTTGLCATAALYVVVIMPHLCGVATTDISKMLCFPFAAPRANDSQRKLALNTQYSVSGLKFTGLSAPTGASGFKGYHRFMRGIPIS